MADAVGVWFLTGETCLTTEFTEKSHGNSTETAAIWLRSGLENHGVE